MLASSSSLSTRAARQVLQRATLGARSMTASHPLRALNTSSSSTSPPPSSSAHASEIAHFSRLSSSWWSPTGELALLHAMNPVRVQFMRSKMDEVRAWDRSVREYEARAQGRAMEEVRDEREGLGWLEGVETLDVGCGGGLLTESLARLGACVHGIDAAHSNIQMANLHASRDPDLPLVSAPSSSAALGKPSLSYEHTTAEDLLLARRAARGAGNEGYEVVAAMEVLEHVNGPAEFLKTLAQLVKPGGHLFISTIARTPLSYALTILMAEHVLRLVSPGTHTHARYVNPTELVDFFKTDVPWLVPSSSSSLEDRRSDRLRVETRGVAYLPWKGAWELAPRWAKGLGSEQANYFFWIRRPLDS